MNTGGMSSHRLPRLVYTTLLAALVFTACAAAFTFAFNRTYMFGLRQLHEWINQTHERISREVSAGLRQGDPTNPLSGYTSQEDRTRRRLYAYGVGSDFYAQWERPGNNMSNVYQLTTLLFVVLCPPLAFLGLRWARARLDLGSLENDEHSFRYGVLVRLVVPLLLLSACAGLISAAGLVGARLLQVWYQPAFNENTFVFSPVKYHRDYLGRGLATLISCAAMLAVVTWGIYPYFARRTLRQLGRCAKCAYPRGDNTKCPECGSSHA